MNDRMRVGFIGIGNMGWPMAANLVRAGFDVAVHDADPTRMQAFCREFQARAPGLAGLATCEVVVTMLPDGHVVRRVLLEGDGGAFINTVQPGKVVVDMSSSEPTGTRELAARLARSGVALVDAPVSGAVPRATDGTLTIMIGSDDAEAAARARPVLEALGTRLFEVGGCGCGHAAKALNNYLGATAESLGRAVGLDAPLLRLVDQRWALARERLGFDADNSEAIKGWQDDLPPR